MTGVLPGADSVRAASAALFVLSLVAAPLAAGAQPAPGIPRVGYLANNLAAQSAQQEAFVQGLRELGYVEGRNLAIEYRDAEGTPERFPELAAELVALKVDLIVAPTTLAALAARRRTATIPIVFATAGDPVGSGLVASLARPGGNVTGMSILAPDLVGKRLELLTQAFPGIGRIAVLRQSGAMGARMDRDMQREADTAARALGVRLQYVEARAPADLDRAFADMTRGHADAVSVWGSTMFSNERTRLVELAATSRLPAVYTSGEFVEAGGLMAYGPNLADRYRRVAGYVDRILRGARPADLPVEQPTTFELLVNLKAAKVLRLALPPALLRRADRIIE